MAGRRERGNPKPAFPAAEDPKRILRVPNDLMADYYTQRASAGMIIAEATSVSEQTWSRWIHQVSAPRLY
jgi:2,4-dienoyl-CoA reductase-like NADH-dependent reductase (Old Yellow Enzyme family)